MLAYARTVTMWPCVHLRRNLGTLPARSEYTQSQTCPTKNSVQIEIVAFTEPQPVTFPGHADSTFLSARLFPSSCLSASRDFCTPPSALGPAAFEPWSPAPSPLFWPSPVGLALPH